MLDASRAAGHFSSWRHPVHMSTATVNRIGKFAFTPIESWSSKRFFELMCIPGIEVRYDFGEDNLLFLRFRGSRVDKRFPVLYHNDLAELEQGPGSDRSHPFTSLKQMQPTLSHPTNHINNSNFVPDFKASAGFPVVETSVLGLGGPFFSKRCFGCGVRRRRGGHL